MDFAQLATLAPPQAEPQAPGEPVPAQPAATSPTLVLNLFEDARFDAVVERRVPAVAGHMLRGKLLGAQGGRWTLMVRRGMATGTVLTPTRAFVVSVDASGLHRVAEVDRTLFPPDDPNAEWRVRVPPDPVGPPPERARERAPVERAGQSRQLESPRRWEPLQRLEPSRQPEPTQRSEPRRPREPAQPPDPSPDLSPQSPSPQAQTSATPTRQSAPRPYASHQPGLPAAGGTWRPIGPAPIYDGQVENVAPDNEVVGAIHTVLAHPTNANVLYVGAVNGGIWRTDDATSTRPTWRPLTDSAPSLSISAMAFDPNDPNTVLAGIGRYSSYGQAGGDQVGLLLTQDGGANWRHVELRYSDIYDRNISGVAVDGNRFVVAVGPWANLVYRSLDGGATWSPADGLPSTGALDLVVDPTDRNRLYVTMRERGVYLSEDGGASWRNVSAHDEALNAAFTVPVVDALGQTGENNNAEMAVASDGRLYIGVLVAGQAHYIGFTDDQGATWTAMDLPLTPEPSGETVGLNPRFKAGGQGAIHFSIRADPTQPNIVYVGGDRQDLCFGPEGPCGNFIGAEDYTGRLFRGNTAIAPTGGIPSPQWEHLTHSDAVAETPGGGTRSSSAPHADSREMVFDASGDIIEVDDGGIYRRTSPRDNTGDWFSLNGNLQVSEMHDVAYDPLGEVVIGGNQDTGTPEQAAAGAKGWDSVATADGGDVAVDASNAPEYSIRYSSVQFLLNFRRYLYNADNEVIEYQFPRLTQQEVSVYEAAPEFGFVQPVVLNAVAPHRGVLPTESWVYETHDRFDTITAVHAFGLNEEATTAAYGCATNPDLLYVGGFVGGSTGILVRTDADGEFSQTAYGGDAPRAILIHPDDCATVYAADATDVYVSHDTGATWRNITGNLGDAPVLHPDLRQLEFLPSGGPLGDVAVLVAGRGGVHAMFTEQEGNWLSLNDGLPHAPAWDLDYEATDNVLVVSTLGRGAWRLEAGPVAVRSIEDLALEVADGDGSVRLAGVFRDPGGSALTYEVTSADDTIAEVSVVGDVVTITPRAAGAVRIHVTARNARGAAGATTFTVAVGALLNIAGPAGAAEGAAARFTLTLSRALNADAEIFYGVFDGDGATRRITVPAGAREAAIDVAIEDDDLIEPWRETFTVELVNPERNEDFGLGFASTATLTVQEGVCDNTAAVRNAVLQLLGIEDCAAADNPAAVTALDLSRNGISRLKPGEFSHMRALRSLDLSANTLTELPEQAFSGELATLSLRSNRLRDLPYGVFFNVPGLRELDLRGNALTKLPRSVFYRLAQLTALRLEGNPGAPFALVIRALRVDAPAWSRRSPAVVFAAIYEGAPFTTRVALRVVDGAAVATEVSLRAGNLASDLALVEQRDGRAAYAQFLAPPLPSENFTGFALVPGEPLLLFKARPRVVKAPPTQSLDVEGDPIVLDLNEVFGDYDSAELNFVATVSDDTLATASIEDGLLTIVTTGVEGVLTVTVTATDADGLSVTLTIRVEVEPVRGLRSWRFFPFEED